MDIITSLLFNSLLFVENDMVDCRHVVCRDSKSEKNQTII